MTEQHYLQVGYEVSPDPEELQRHLNIFLLNDDERKKALGEKAKAVRNQRWLYVGFSKEQMSRHFLIIGTTGAGKTSLIMTALKEVMPKGGGAIFIDGKSDTAMTMKFIAIAEKCGRLSDYYIVNLLSPEKSHKDTNTINPLATLSAAGQIVFLTSLASEGEQSGDSAYWLGRGRALLTPVIQLAYFRKEFYGEPYSYETVSQFLSASEFGFAVTVLYCMAKAMNDKIANDKRLNKLLNTAKKIVTPRSEVPEFEALITYIIQNPYKTSQIEKLGYSRLYLDALYSAFSSALTIYLKTLSA
jgi:energy-coupling factor transporter ATP-binding protein EcfA2